MELLVPYIETVTDHWEALREGDWRLGLAVAGPNGGAEELRELTSLARSAPNHEFRDDLAGGVHQKKLRERLGRLDTAVAKAATKAGVGLSAGRLPELSWRLLFGLRVIVLRLEGDDPPDRTTVINRLRQAVGEGSEAEDLFGRLCGLASGYGPRGAVVDDAKLRRDLHGLVRLSRSPSFDGPWRRSTISASA